MARLRDADAEKRRTDTHGPDFLEGLARGLRVITAFDADRRAMTLSDVARVVDLPKATVRRALHTLTCLGYVEQEGRSFKLTQKILNLAISYLSSSGVAAVSQPICDRISGEVSEACSVAVMYGENVLMVAHSGPKRMLELSAVGLQLPAFCTSLGRVILASRDEDDMSASVRELTLQPYTPRTITDRKALLKELRIVRDQGFSMVDQEMEIGYRSIAVPIFHYNGKIVGALHIGGRVERMEFSRMQEELLPILRQAADDLKGLLV